MDRRSIEQVIFVSPRNEQLGHFIEFLPGVVPMGVGLLAARMRSLGENVQIWDLEVRNRSQADVYEVAPNNGSKTIFGISCMTSNAAQGYEFARLVRVVAPEALIVFGGIHPTAVPEEALKLGVADAVVRGEGEEVFPELLRRWRSGEDIAGQPGITSCVSNGLIVHGPAAPLINDISHYPSFPYDMLDLSRYCLGFITTSRGCPYDCAFCSQRIISGRHFRYRPTESVINELEFLVKDCQQQSIMFVDDLFTGNYRRVVALCQAIQQRGLNRFASFGAQVRADSINPGILRTMKEAGFNNLSFGIETGSERILTFINKGETLAQIVQGARLARGAGFNTEGVFIFGFPGEHLDDRLRAVKLSKELQLSRVRFNNLVPYPGTRVFEMAKEEGRLIVQKGWRNFNSAGAASSSIGSGFELPYAPKGTTRAALEGEVILANIFSYLSIRRIRQMVTPKREPSGIGFEFTFQQFLQPKTVFSLFLAVMNMLLRAISFSIRENECRRFFRAVLTGRLPELDPSVQDALDKDLEGLSCLMQQKEDNALTSLESRNQ